MVALEEGGVAGGEFVEDVCELGDVGAQGSSRVYNVFFSRAWQGTDAGSGRGTFSPTPGPQEDSVWGYEGKVGFGVRHGYAG